jgi:ribA/ribD-fused uncharacterized protein
MRTIGNMTLFFSEKDAFSNWYRSDFVVKGVTFNCVEQFMMFCKAKLFGDDNTADKIMKASHPRDHKKLGREVVGYDDDIWAKRRGPIVTHGAYAKFSQNEEIKTLLLSTNGTMLVEASKYDKLWGAGLAEDNPKILDPKNWPGQNLLGGVLEDVRERLTLELANGQSQARPERSKAEDHSTPAP